MNPTDDPLVDADDTRQTPPASMTRPKVRWTLSTTAVPSHTVLYACLAGVLGGLIVAPAAYVNGWAPAWLAGSVIAGWRGLLLAGWAVVADRLIPSVPRPARWALAFGLIGLIPDLEVGLYAYIVIVTRTIKFPILMLIVWVLVAALRDSVLGLSLGWSVEQPSGARWKSAAVAGSVWGAYRIVAILVGGPALGLPVVAYGSAELLVQITVSLMLAAALIGWTFAGRLRYAVETRVAPEQPVQEPE